MPPRPAAPAPQRPAWRRHWPGWAAARPAPPPRRPRPRGQRLPSPPQLAPLLLTGPRTPRVQGPLRSAPQPATRRRAVAPRAPTRASAP
eukprot:scaffold82595_cov27-Phaeocystis_antarctica.AAC.1